MARRGFPALISVRLDSEGWTWGPEVGPAMVAAFEGVAGTLKALAIRHKIIGGGDGVLRQLGEAIGKLRLLEDLELDVGGQGLKYYHVAQGMGEGACPAIRSLSCAIESGAGWLACRPSIIQPSVQNLYVTFGGVPGPEPLALAGALALLDFRGSVVMKNVFQVGGGQRERVRELLKSRLSRLRVQL
jgi:hypothetical protein